MNFLHAISRGSSRLGRGVLSASILFSLAWGDAARGGPLDPPPGPVSPTGKTLAEVEPRTAISSANTPGDATCVYKITRPGSYYFTGDINGVAGKHGIKIALGTNSGTVNISMNGFSLRGVPGSLNGYEWDLDNDGMYDEWTLNNDGSLGAIENWGGLAINSRVPGRVQNIVSLFSCAGGFIALSSCGNHVTTFEGCTMRTSGGPALVNDSSSPIVLRRCRIEGSGCDTTSLLVLGGDAEIAGLSVVAQNSTFSGPIIDVGPAAGLTHSDDGGIMSATAVTALSAMRIAAGGKGVVNYEWNFNFSAAFSVAMIDLARDNADIRRLHVRADASATAPVGMKVAGINVALDEGLWFMSPSAVPLVIDVTGSSSTVQHTTIATAGVGIRLTGSANTVSDCRIVGTGTGAVTGVLIANGSSNNAVFRNEFVRLGAGAPVNNLGGVTNAVGPIATPASMTTATNPFSSLQH